MAAKSKKPERLTEIRNKKAHHKYFVEEKFEAGVALKGTEVKSIRLGKAQISESFVRIEKGEAILYNTHIDEYAFGSDSNHNPTRPRKLLLHKKQIRKLQHAIDAEAKTIVPLRLYFKEALVKIEIAICKGKKLHDKRETIKSREALRDAERAIRRR